MAVLYDKVLGGRFLDNSVLMNMFIRQKTDRKIKTVTQLQ